MDVERLREKTKQLQQLNQEALQIYEETMKKNQSPDFYTEVNPFADEVKKHADEWKELAEQWIIQSHPKYFYVKQIQDTYDNILYASVLAFQTDTKKKRFHEMIQSIDYILEGILKE